MTGRWMQFCLSYGGIFMCLEPIYAISYIFIATIKIFRVLMLCSWFSGVNYHLSNTMNVVKINKTTLKNSFRIAYGILFAWLYVCKVCLRYLKIFCWKKRAISFLIFKHIFLFNCLGLILIKGNWVYKNLWRSESTSRKIIKNGRLRGASI